MFESSPENERWLGVAPRLIRAGALAPALAITDKYGVFPVALWCDTCRTSWLADAEVLPERHRLLRRTPVTIVSDRHAKVILHLTCPRP